MIIVLFIIMIAAAIFAEIPSPNNGDNGDSGFDPE